jgi:predicted solute-binding protein
MKQLFATFLICLSFSFLIAQDKNISITPALEKRFLSDSINVVLSVPSTYKIVSCNLILTTTKGDAFRINYSTKSYASKTLKEFIDHHEKGSKIIFADMEVIKDNRKLKLAEQHYIYQ